MLEPVTLPSTISKLPRRVAVMETTNSGMEVPNAIIEAATTSFPISSFVANSIALSTVNLAPTSTPAKPTTTQITALFAVEGKSSEIVIGTVLGSNIANILLILGLTAILAKSFTITWDLLHGDLPILFGSLLLLGFVIYPLSLEDQNLFKGLGTQISQSGSGDSGGRAFITIGESIILLAGYALYLHYYTIRHKEEAAKGNEEAQERPKFNYMAVWPWVRRSLN